MEETKNAADFLKNDLSPDKNVLKGIIFSLVFLRLGILDKYAIDKKI